MLDSRHRRSQVATVRAELVEAYAGRFAGRVAFGDRDRSIHRDADSLLFWARVEMWIAIGKTGYRRIGKLPVRTVENGVQCDHLAIARFSRYGHRGIGGCFDGTSIFVARGLLCLFLRGLGLIVANALLPRCQDFTLCTCFPVFDCSAF